MLLPGESGPVKAPSLEGAEHNHVGETLIIGKAEGNVEWHPVPHQIETIDEIGVPAQFFAEAWFACFSALAARNAAATAARPSSPSFRATLLSFLQAMLGQSMLGATASGNAPFQVVCDTSNNPAARTALGYVQADVQVQYMAINEKFIVNVDGGQTVTIQNQTLPSGQIA